MDQLLSQPVDPPPEPTDDDTMASEIRPESSNSGVMKKEKTKKKKKNKACVNDPFDPSSSVASHSSSSCSATSFPHSIQRGIRVSTSRRKPRVIIGSCRQKSENVEALALPLGMSIAAVLAQVLVFFLKLLMELLVISIYFYFYVPPNGKTKGGAGRLKFWTFLACKISLLCESWAIDELGYWFFAWICFFSNVKCVFSLFDSYLLMGFLCSLNTVI